MINLKVDPEFQAKIPPLTQDEFNQLRDNILDDGEVFEPIIIWNGIIVDGHNRWRVLQEHPEIPFKTREMIFFDKWEAFDWMYKKQLGRRNLTNEQRLRLIGQMQETRKQAHGNHAKRDDETGQYLKGQNEPLGETPKTTAETIAREVGVSESTVKRAEKFSKGIDVLEEVSKEAAEKVLSGKSGVTKAAIMELPKLEPFERKNVAQAIIENKPVQIESSSKKDEVEKSQSYTIENLLFDITDISDRFVKSFRQILASKNQCYQDLGNKDRVLKAINSTINQIKNLGEEL